MSKGSFNGDFAYALWDRRNQRLVMARDRMGVRPLYYAVRDAVLVFASEVKSLFVYPGLRAEVDPLGLDQCSRARCSGARGSRGRWSPLRRS